MGEGKQRKPAVEGWFTMDAKEPRLLGSRCTECGTYFFPKETAYCRNPRCASSDLEELPLGPRGRLWSFTDNCYAPPAPYMSPDPFAPYAIAAVELEREKMVVLGQVVKDVGVDALEAGMEMELALETLYQDAENDYLIWKWRPTAS